MDIGRVYKGSTHAVSVSTAQDLCELNAPADAVVIVHSVTVTQSSDYGNAEAEGLAIQIRRGDSTSGSGGSAVTPTPVNKGDAAFGGTLEMNNTTQATADGDVLHAENFNAQVGLFYLPPPSDRDVLSPCRS